MRYLIIFLIELLLIVGSINVNVEKITPWLLGINFTFAIFSINFTFFGHQLSKYKPLYDSITSRQWLNIIVLMSLPFIPLFTFLIAPEYFGKFALWVLPIIFWSAIDNAKLTLGYLSPKKYIKNTIVPSIISKYLSSLSNEVNKEVKTHQLYLENKDKFQIPTHAWEFEPTILGNKENDLWDSMAIIIKLSIENNDYPVFRQSISAIIVLLISSYEFKFKEKDNYRVNIGVQKIARNRLRSIINLIENEDKEGIYLLSFSNELCSFLMSEKALESPLSEMVSAVVSDVTWIGRRLLEAENAIEPMKILNTIHAVVELSVHKIEISDQNNISNSLDKYNIAGYAHLIKSLAISALGTKNAHFSYRCMESLSYLGCNAAKQKSRQTVASTLESLVQVGRVAKSKNLGCFWSRCIIPIESHAEEFMGHILTWLVRDIDDNGHFFLKGCAEQAYSRIRGISCTISPDPKFNPKFWIHEELDNGKLIKHVEHESGMYGYEGSFDYSDFSNLKEYILRDFD